jgi:predicted GNAT family acetyltransferase
MKVRSYVDAKGFLERTQAALESHEVANCLMLGVCLRLMRYPGRAKTPPCLRTVEDADGLVLASMMTPPQKLVVHGQRGDLGEAARALAEDLVLEGWQVPGMLGPREPVRIAVGRWADITGMGVRLERRMRLYELRQAESPVPGRGRLRLATVADTELVAGWRYAFQVDVFGEAGRSAARRAAQGGIERGEVYLWEDGEPASMAVTTRPTRNGISVGLVYTPPQLRGRGYATACVGELSRLLLESGWRYCALFADLANVPANRVYQRIGYEPTCDYAEYVFLDQE